MTGLVSRAREGSVYSQMMMRKRVKDVLLKRMAKRTSRTVEEVEDMMINGQANELLDDDELVRFLENTRDATDEWTERLLSSQAQSTGQFDDDIVRIMKKVEEY